MRHQLAPAILVSIILLAYCPSVFASESEQFAPNSSWEISELAKLTASDGAFEDGFGRSVAASGDIAFVGAPNARIGTNSQQGAVYVFLRPEAGWVSAIEIAKLTASDGEAGDRFGISVASSGGTVVVGAPGNDHDGMDGRGSAYIFDEPPGGWTGDLVESAKLVAGDGAPFDSFGDAVAVSGSVAAVGAPRAAVGINPDQGAGYIFPQPQGGWKGTLVSNTKLVTSEDRGGVFGSRIAMSNNRVVIANPAEANRGSLYVFVKPPGGWSGTMVESAKLDRIQKRRHLPGDASPCCHLEHRLGAV